MSKQLFFSQLTCKLLRASFHIGYTKSHSIIGVSNVKHGKYLMGNHRNQLSHNVPNKYWDEIHWNIVRRVKSSYLCTYLSNICKLTHPPYTYLVPFLVSDYVWYHGSGTLRKIHMNKSCPFFFGNFTGILLKLSWVHNDMYLITQYCKRKIMENTILFCSSNEPWDTYISLEVKY